MAYKGNNDNEAAQTRLLAVTGPQKSSKPACHEGQISCVTLLTDDPATLSTSPTTGSLLTTTTKIPVPSVTRSCDEKTLPNYSTVTSEKETTVKIQEVLTLQQV